MPRHSLLVLTTPFEGTDEEFNRWYDDQHLADVLDIPGFLSARRYRIVESRYQGEALLRWRYLAIYEIECDDLSQALDEIRKRSNTAAMPISDTLDMSQVATLVMQPLSSIPPEHG